jgi:hypothetical protein
MGIYIYIPAEECFIVDCNNNMIVDCYGRFLSCGRTDCVESSTTTTTSTTTTSASTTTTTSTSSTTTTAAPSTTSTTTTGAIVPTTTTTTTSGGPDEDVILYMAALGIPDNGTVYYEGSPQEITGAELWDAVTNLVNSLKTSGVWQRSVAIYPYVGGTSNRHKFNLKNPQDTNAARRLTFLDTWTHSATGATPTTANSYGETYIYPVEDVPQYSFTGGTYFRTIGIVGNINFYAFGITGNLDQDNGGIYMYLNGNGNYELTAGTMGSNLIVGNTPLGYTGFMSMTCFRDNVFRFYKNTTLINSNSQSRKNYFQNTRPMDATGTLQLATRLIGSSIQPVAVNCERAFDFFGWGLDTMQHTALNNAIAAFQTALNRNV